MRSVARALPRFATTQTRRASAISLTNFIQLQQSSNLKSNYSTESLDVRYKNKLLQKAEEQGFKSVEELKEKLKEDIETKKKELSKVDPLKELEEYEQRLKMSQNNMKVTQQRGPVDPKQELAPFKTLDSFLKLERIKDLSKQEVEFLWRARWANKPDALSAVVPLEIFEKMDRHIRACPTFVLPLPREVPAEASSSGTQEQGMELHYIQWQMADSNTVHCIMTSLAEYKLHSEFAKPHTTFQFHKELASDKKIILMNGHVEKDVNITLPDAQLLLLNIQRFYGAMGEETVSSKQRTKLLHDFAKGSPEFSVEKLINLAQSMET